MGSQKSERDSDRIIVSSPDPALLQLEINYYKWKNHFSEMKGDVGMSVHEKEGEQEDA